MKIVYIIFSGIFSFIVGSVLGIIGKTVGYVEDVIYISRSEYSTWRRYPKKYTQFLYARRANMAERNMEEATNEWDRIKYKKKLDKYCRLYRRNEFKPPFFGFYVLYHLVACLLMLPFSWLVAFIEGPQVVFEQCMVFYKTKLGGENG